MFFHLYPKIISQTDLQSEVGKGKGKEPFSSMKIHQLLLNMHLNFYLHALHLDALEYSEGTQRK